eukprot:gene32594-42214_t
MYFLKRALWSFLLIIATAFALPENQEFIKILEAAFSVTNSSINSLLTEWQVSDYPNFLKSCFMHKHSWDIMKLKYMDRILSAENSKSRKQFIASFLGSYFNQSTPVVAGNILKAAFQALNIDFVAKNVALIGNPCMPYDVCMKIFVGEDADIGETLSIIFVRQAMTIPTKPIVVFSEDQKQCKSPPHQKSPHEVDLLSSTDLKIVSKLNRDEFERAWGFLSGIDRTYHQAGIQTFQHEKHTAYACLGPYIKSWSEGAASWHPSVIGHRLRASHHAYFWLLILRDAHHKTKADITLRTKSLMDQFYSIRPSFSEQPNPASDTSLSAAHSGKRDLPLSEIKPKFNSPFVDGIQCYTDYEPRSIRNASLSNVLVSVTGFIDYMHVFYGNKDSGPISVLASLSKPGPSPATWGKMPTGFKFMWETKFDVYVTQNVASPLPTFSSTGDKLDSAPGAFKFQKGFKMHVVTIVPKDAAKIILAWLVTA